MELTLKEVYKYILETFEELNSLLDEEKNVLLANSGEELMKIVERKSIIIKKASLLEEKRIVLTGDAKISDMIQSGHVTEDDISTLKSLTKEIQYKNETNKMLTTQSLHYIRAIKFALTPNQNTVTTYGNHGEIGEKTSDSIFSTKL